MKRRPTLLVASASLGIVGIGLLMVPFLQSMNLSAKAQATTRTIDLTTIEPGTYKRIYWSGKPVVVLRTNNELIASLEGLNEVVWGPHISPGSARSVYVYEAVSTYRGCPLTDTKDYPHLASLPDGWIDLCHIGLWDYSGRAFREHNVPEGTRLPNLTTLNYRVVDDATIYLHH